MGRLRISFLKFSKLIKFYCYLELDGLDYISNVCENEEPGDRLTVAAMLQSRHAHLRRAANSRWYLQS